jgi:hypothetical protein
MMVFVDMMMNLLGRQFGAFVALVINIFGLFLGHRIFRLMLLLLLLLVLLVAADHSGSSYSVLMPGDTDPGQLDLHVVFFGRRQLRMDPFPV